MNLYYSAIVTKENMILCCSVFISETDQGAFVKAIEAFEESTGVKFSQVAPNVQVNVTKIDVLDGHPIIVGEKVEVTEVEQPSAEATEGQQ